MATRVVMYSTGVCPYCNMAERLLKAKGIDEIEKIRIDLDPVQRAEMMEKPGVVLFHRFTSAKPMLGVLMIFPHSTARAS